MLEGGGGQCVGEIKGGNWKNYNSIINKKHLKTRIFAVITVGSLDLNE